MYDVASRTGRTIKNGHVAMLYYVVNLLLGFYSRKIFIDYVGIDVLGLNQTAQNLLGFLNIAELGIGGAVAFCLYGPIARKEYDTINEIVHVQGWLYRRVALIIGVGAIVLMAFFPMIFGDIKLPLWYAYSSFGVFLYSSLLTYFVNYKQILFSASQQEYRITINYNFTLIYKTIAQIFVLKYFPNPYVWWLILQVVGSTAASWRLNRAINKAFPFIQNKVSNGKEMVEKYKVIITKTKQLFFHAVSGFALTQSSPLLIYAYVDIKMVAIYSNYMLIANCLRMIFNAVFTGITSGVGNLIAEGNMEKCLSVFEELFSVKFLIIVTLLVSFAVAVNPFIAIWLGDGFFLNQSTILIIVMTLYIIMSETTTGSFKQAFGQYQDIWAPVAEAVLNIGLSILLGFYYGINGVLMGPMISLIIIISGWKPYFVFHYCMRISYFRYIKMYFKHIFAFAITMIVVFSLWRIINLSSPSNYLTWVATYTLFALLFFIVMSASLYIFTPGIRLFFIRFKSLFIKR